ncbi:MAG: hypothetical protein NPIRA05_01730 [Nitrospirales bacterium]|nr:MAG: hypothetical protein NPIRA05_01730 [Nitrospirales bacterium]
MVTSCTFLHPLQRDGTSQHQRLVVALQPTSVLIDERSLSDLLEYAHHYASLLQYYTVSNGPGGDWVEFIDQDISTLVALIQTTSYQSVKTAFQQQREHILTVGVLERPAAFAALFPHVVELAGKFDAWYRHSIEGLSLRTALSQLIQSVLNDAFRSLLAHALRAEEVGFPVETIEISAFSSLWDLSGIQPDSSLFPSNQVDNEDDLRESINRHAIVFDRFYESLVFLVNAAPSYLDETLENHPEHHPHMALFLAFLKIFEHAQQHVNELTGKHLDFYYKNVLALEQRAEVPGQVHLIFELAKNFSSQLVRQNTEVKAGKDASGLELLYATDAELVVNQAVLHEEHGLKSVFIEENPKDGSIKNIYAAPIANSADGLGEELAGEEKKWGAFGSTEMPYAEVGFAIASPMFLLAEGTRTVTLKFQLVSPPDFVDEHTGNDVAQELRSNVTVLASGEKEWLNVLVKQVEIVNGFDVYSSDQETIEKNQAKKPDGKEKFLKYVLEIGAETPAVVGYDNIVLDGELETTLPVIKFVLNNEGLSAKHVSQNNMPRIRDYSNKVPSYDFGDLARMNRKIYRAKLPIPQPAFDPIEYVSLWEEVETAYPYKYFQSLELNDLEISLNVHGVTSLILENDVGILDPAKPFYPFGPVPRVGSRFLIGSHEIFQKPVSKVDMAIQWTDLPLENFKTHYSDYILPGNASVSNNEYFTASLSILEGGKWTPVTDLDDYQLFLPSGTKDAPLPDRSVSVSFSDFSRDPTLEPFDRFESSGKQGFLSFQLKKSFLHTAYPRSLAEAVITPGNVPNPPYTPLITSFSLDYEAKQQVGYPASRISDVPKRAKRIFQIGPFGYQEIYPVQDDGTTSDVLVSRKLVPEFSVTVQEAGGPVRTEVAQGTLYVGFQRLHPPQNLSLLIQVAEGSEDPSKAVQTVVWSYLANGRWADFKSSEIIADGTNGLLTSGVLKFAMPRDIGKEETLLPGDIHWIKASVQGPVDAVPKLIAVHPQAAVASFRNHGNDPTHLSQPLPAETISKLKKREAAIKSVSQPYASFGGRMIEADDAFYIRVSERLRHKGRAVTIFDYERLVLEQFPEVYKVKCINHTKEGSEFSPGSVKLIVVPNLRNKNAVDPLKPRLSLHKLEEIKKYLMKKSSNFVSIEVANPEYEEIRVLFDVRFMPGRDKGFFTMQLNTDIIKFLSPWLYDDVADLTFGGRIHRSSILNYVEEREYVDFVINFQLDHLRGDEGELKNQEEAKASSSSAALVSAKEHEIGHNIVSCEDQEANSEEAEENLPPTEPSPPSQSVPQGFQQYLGNIRSRELHDLLNLKPQCQVDEIALDRRIYFSKTVPAISKGYDYCAYCFSRKLSQR